MENSVLADSEVVQKKRRRTGWDAPASQPSSSSGPSGPTLMNPAVSVVTGLNAPNQLLAHQQAQQILLAQQVLAQSVAAAAVKTGLPLAPQSASMTVTNAVAPMISMMIPTPYVPRPECRIYVG